MLNRARASSSRSAPGWPRTARSRAQLVFARKNYFYPDLPKGYQISQYELPLCKGGYVDIAASTASGRGRVSLARIHMEEDAGKNIHDAPTSSLVDFNRSGVPLLEIVSEPDIRSPAEAGAYLRELRAMLRYLEISDGNMEEGSFRCDANVSVRPRGASELGTKTEVKNMNSFRNVEHAIAHEIERQIAALEARRARRAGDPSVGPRPRGDAPDALQGVRARLPLLPRARPAAAQGLARPGR